MNDLHAVYFWFTMCTDGLLCCERDECETLLFCQLQDSSWHYDSPMVFCSSVLELLGVLNQRLHNGNSSTQVLC